MVRDEEHSAKQGEGEQRLTIVDGRCHAEYECCEDHQEMSDLQGRHV